MISFLEDPPEVGRPIFTPNAIAALNSKSAARSEQGAISKRRGDREIDQSRAECYIAGVRALRARVACPEKPARHLVQKPPRSGPEKPTCVRGRATDGIWARSKRPFQSSKRSSEKRPRETITISGQTSGASAICCRTKSAPISSKRQGLKSIGWVSLPWPGPIHPVPSVLWILPLARGVCAKK